MDLNSRLFDRIRIKPRRAAEAPALRNLLLSCDLALATDVANVNDPFAVCVRLSPELSWRTRLPPAASPVIAESGAVTTRITSR